MTVSHFSNSPSPALLPLIRQIRQGRVNKGQIFFFQPEVNITHGQPSCLVCVKLMKAELPFYRNAHVHTKYIQFGQ